MNTRRFPRSLSEAWPDSEERTGMHYYRRRPSHWPGTLVLLALMWIFVGLFLLAGCSEVADAQATELSKQDAIAMAQAEALGGYRK